jgi:Arc/MetJ-type ribon-helix-helix transcriptional regulator
MTEQIAVRIPERLAADLEELVATGRYDTKAEAIRSALEALVDAERRAEVGRRVAEGYRRIPQEDEEVAAATEAAIRSIHEEPW